MKMKVNPKIRVKKMKANPKIRVKLQSFNAELLVYACQKFINKLNGVNNISKNSVRMVTLPTTKRIYCVLRSPHVDKDSREHFEIRIHKRMLEIEIDSDLIEVSILNLLIDMNYAPGILCQFRTKRS